MLIVCPHLSKYNLLTKNCIPIYYLGSKEVAIHEKHFFGLKMAIFSKLKMGAWLQILQVMGNSALFYLLIDTHDSPGSIFKFTKGFGIVGKV